MSKSLFKIPKVLKQTGKDVFNDVYGTFKKATTIKNKHKIVFPKCKSCGLENRTQVAFCLRCGRQVGYTY